jgi:hypothetical protein
LLEDLLTLVADSFNGSGESEVTEFNGAVLVDEDVGWLEVTVENFALMNVLDGM